MPQMFPMPLTMLTMVVGALLLLSVIRVFWHSTQAIQSMAVTPAPSPSKFFQIW